MSGLFDIGVYRCLFGVSGLGLFAVGLHGVIASLVRM